MEAEPTGSVAAMQSNVTRRLARLAACLCVLFLATSPAYALRIVTWNVLHVPPGSLTSMRTVLAAIDPDVIVCQEVDNTTDVNDFLNTVLNGAGGPGGFVAATFTNGFDSDNALFYRPSKVTFAGAADHLDVNTSLRQIDRWKLGLAGYSSADSQVYVYSMHLKAGSSSSDQNQRLTETTLLRNNGNLLPAGSNLIYSGDFNIRSSSEAAYQQMVGFQADNDGRVFDPINAPGNWNNNGSFALIHTQSPHSNGSGAPPGAATGGVDDRFDQILVSASMDDQEGFAALPSTYRTFGNDGNHFNADINDPPTIPEGATIANALHASSDHLPVLCDFQVPARAGTSGPVNFGSVFLDATAQQTLTVTNVGDLVLFDFVDDLDYSLSASTGFNAPAGTFSELAGGGGNGHTITMDTGAVGPLSGTVVVASDDPEAPSLNVAASGNVLAHARPSLDGGSQVFTAIVDFGTAAMGGFSDQGIDVHNFNFSALQGDLEVYAAQFSGPDAARFSIAGGFTPFTVGASPVPVSIAFDDSGPGGSYSADLVLFTRDDQGLPGAINLSGLTLQLDAEIQSGPDTQGGDTAGGPFRSVTVKLGGTQGLTLDAGDLTPGERVYAVLGHPRGLTHLTGCAGTTLNLTGGRAVTAAVADATGQAHLRIPARLANLAQTGDLAVQLVEPSTCRTSDVLPLR